MPRPMTTRRSPAPRVSPESSGPFEGQKFSINLSADLGNELKQIAFQQRVSESSIIEVALRQIFHRISPDRLGAFLKQNGACLRRRS